MCRNINNKFVHLGIGYFLSKENAAKAYNAVMFHLYNDWYMLNEIPGCTNEESIIMPEGKNIKDILERINALITKYENKHKEVTTLNEILS